MDDESLFDSVCNPREILCEDARQSFIQRGGDYGSGLHHSIRGCAAHWKAGGRPGNYTLSTFYKFFTIDTLLDYPDPFCSRWCWFRRNSSCSDDWCRGRHLQVLRHNHRVTKYKYPDLCNSWKRRESYLYHQETRYSSRPHLPFP
jgi:hypothetical protein